MSAVKTAITAIIVLAMIAIAAYGLFVFGGGNVGGSGGEGGDSGGFRSINTRTVVTLAVFGGSAFITGFGLRDVIGRVMATRQRNRLKKMQEHRST